jgi:hypothetical protein
MTALSVLDTIIDSERQKDRERENAVEKGDGNAPELIYSVAKRKLSPLAVQLAERSVLRQQQVLELAANSPDIEVTADRERSRKEYAADENTDDKIRKKRSNSSSKSKNKSRYKDRDKKKSVVAFSSTAYNNEANEGMTHMTNTAKIEENSIEAAVVSYDDGSEGIIEGMLSFSLSDMALNNDGLPNESESVFFADEVGNNNISGAVNISESYLMEGDIALTLNEDEGKGMGVLSEDGIEPQSHASAAAAAADAVDDERAQERRRERRGRSRSRDERSGRRDRDRDRDNRDRDDNRESRSRRRGDNLYQRPLIHRPLTHYYLSPLSLSILLHNICG